MHGLPESFDPSFLMEKEVETLTFTTYQTNIQFDGGVWLQIEGGYTLSLNVEVIETVREFPIAQSSLMQLIGKKITNVSFVRRNGDIELTLEDGYKLFLEGDIGPYESYRFFDGQKEIIV